MVTKTQEGAEPFPTPSNLIEFGDHFNNFRAEDLRHKKVLHIKVETLKRKAQADIENLQTQNEELRNTFEIRQVTACTETAELKSKIAALTRRHEGFVSMYLKQRLASEPEDQVERAQKELDRICIRKFQFMELEITGIFRSLIDYEVEKVEDKAEMQEDIDGIRDRLDGMEIWKEKVQAMEGHIGDIFNRLDDIDAKMQTRGG